MPLPQVKQMLQRFGASALAFQIIGQPGAALPVIRRLLQHESPVMFGKIV